MNQGDSESAGRTTGGPRPRAPWEDIPPAAATDRVGREPISASDVALRSTPPGPPPGNPFAHDDWPKPDTNGPPSPHVTPALRPNPAAAPRAAGKPEDPAARSERVRREVALLSRGFLPLALLHVVPDLSIEGTSEYVRTLRAHAQDPEDENERMMIELAALLHACTNHFLAQAVATEDPVVTKLMARLGLDASGELRRTNVSLAQYRTLTAVRQRPSRPETADVTGGDTRVRHVRPPSAEAKTS